MIWSITPNFFLLFHTNPLYISLYWEHFQSPRVCWKFRNKKCLLLANGAVTLLDFNSLSLSFLKYSNFGDSQLIILTKMREREKKFPEITSRSSTNDARRWKGWITISVRFEWRKKKVENQLENVFKVIRIVESKGQNLAGLFLYWIVMRGAKLRILLINLNFLKNIILNLYYWALNPFFITLAF